jgi:hypothetical protein
MLIHADLLFHQDIDNGPDFVPATPSHPPPYSKPDCQPVVQTVSGSESFFDRALPNGNLETEPQNSNVAVASVALNDWAKDEDQDLTAHENRWDLDVGGNGKGIGDDVRLMLIVTGLACSVIACCWKYSNNGNTLIAHTHSMHAHIKVHAHGDTIGLSSDACVRRIVKR